LLSKIVFDEIRISYSVPGQQKYENVIAKQNDGHMEIRVEGVHGVLVVPISTERESRISRYRRPIDESVDLIGRILEVERNSPVLEHLNDLSGPLYLPIDRRWPVESEASPRTTRTRPSTTAGHLPIADVLALAESGTREEIYATVTLNDELRNKMLTSLFEGDKRTGYQPIWTIEELEVRRERVIAALENLGLRDARRTIDDYFSGVEKISRRLGGRQVPKDLFDTPESDLWFEWLFEASPIASRIDRLIPLIEEYESERQEKTRRSTAFLRSVNSFLNDNGKELKFVRGFDLTVILPNGSSIGAENLSSGELQLLTLFTFLYFRFDPDQEFAVFVDEPELSLHIAWQSRYIENVMAANPNAQFIIATHSPEIIGMFEDRTIEISPRKTANAQI
jgi:hypothetical protein